MGVYETRGFIDGVTRTPQWKWYEERVKSDDSVKKAGLFCMAIDALQELEEVKAENKRLRAKNKAVCALRAKNKSLVAEIKGLEALRKALSKKNNDLEVENKELLKHIRDLE